MFKRVRQLVIAETENRQTPWESSSLTDDFYFKAGAPATQAAGAAASADVVAWNGFGAWT